MRYAHHLGGCFFLKNEYDEKALVDAAKKGDEGAFEALVLSTQAMVYNLALRICEDEEDALDMSQEAYLRAFRSLSSFGSACSFSSWMYTLTKNACFDHLKKKKKRTALSLTLWDEEAQGAEYSLPDDAALPEETLLSHERAAEIRGVLNRLSPAYREVLILYEIEGFSYSEIASALGIEAGAVKSRLFRARTAFRNFLKKTETKAGSDSSKR